MRRFDPVEKTFRESSLRFASYGWLYVRAAFPQLSEIAGLSVLYFVLALVRQTDYLFKWIGRRDSFRFALASIIHCSKADSSTRTKIGSNRFSRSAALCGILSRCATSTSLPPERSNTRDRISYSSATFSKSGALE
jgi:hypothetical protein